VEAISLHARAKSLLEDDELVEAASVLEKAVSLDLDRTNGPAFSAFADAAFLLGTCYQQLERPDDASRILEELLDSADAHPVETIRDFWLDLAGDIYLSFAVIKPMLNWREHDRKRMIEVAERQRDADPIPTAHQLEPRIILAHLFEARGDRSAAVEALDEALYIGRRFRGLEEGRTLPMVHERISRLYREQAREEAFLMRPALWILSAYHALAAFVERQRLRDEDELL